MKTPVKTPDPTHTEDEMDPYTRVALTKQRNKGLQGLAAGLLLSAVTAGGYLVLVDRSTPTEAWEQAKNRNQLYSALEHGTPVENEKVALLAHNIKAAVAGREPDAAWESLSLHTGSYQVDNDWGDDDVYEGVSGDLGIQVFDGEMGTKDAGSLAAGFESTAWKALEGGSEAYLTPLGKRPEREMLQPGLALLMAIVIVYSSTAAALRGQTLPEKSHQGELGLTTQILLMAPWKGAAELKHWQREREEKKALSPAVLEARGYVRELRGLTPRTPEVEELTRSAQEALQKIEQLPWNVQAERANRAARKLHEKTSDLLQVETHVQADTQKLPYLT